MSAWYDFYRSRDPQRYLGYARQRYAPFIALIRGLAYPTGDTVLEAGCGMGTITRALHDDGMPAARFVMVDTDPGMLGMAAHNTRHFHEDRVRLYGVDTAKLDRDPRCRADIIHSHGVLEHFDDEKIRDILRAQRRSGARALVHYVPGEKYDTPSFGDERLMSAQQWHDICEPDAIVPFNEGFDYALVWRFP